MSLIDELKLLIEKYDKPVVTSNYKLSSKSLKELEGVKAPLVFVVKRAIQITTQDFTVFDGIRTVEEQRRLVEKGASQTMNSKHITGDAVDLVPYINGKLRWEWEPIYNIAEAMRTAAKELNVNITWGGNWDLKTFKDSVEPTKTIVDNYVQSRLNQGKSAFIDGPHFELNG